MEYETLLSIWFMVIGALFGVIICSVFINISPNEDIINPKTLGTALCSEQGLQYDHLEYVFVNVQGYADKQRLPKFFCRDEEKITDGIIVKVK